MSNVTTYKRSQIEWAVWALYTDAGTHAAPTLPARFSVRLKRLLELDWYPKPDKNERTAFARSEGDSGTDVEYAAYDAFALGIAVELHSAGFKPSEIISLLRRARPALERQFHACCRQPLPELRAPPPDPDDARVFMVLQWDELDDIRPIHNSKGADSPALPEPHFYKGVHNLSRELGKMRVGRKREYRKVFIIEIAYMARMINECLEIAPVLKRGRKET